MANTNLSQAAIETSPMPTTSQNPFFVCNAEQDFLFTVKEGVPAEGALDMASTFLCAALKSAYDCGDGDDTEKAYTAAYLIEMAKALIDSVSSSMMKDRKADVAVN